jgi:hypothetical protein
MILISNHILSDIFYTIRIQIKSGHKYENKYDINSYSYPIRFHPSPAPARRGSRAARVRFRSRATIFFSSAKKKKRRAASFDAADSTSPVGSFPDAGCRVPRRHVGC